MKERPILFSGEMVRAILEGRKTQTRRAVKMPRSRDAFVLEDRGQGWWPYQSDDGESPLCDDGNEHPYRCPYGQPGDRLWVREAHAIVPRTAYAQSSGVHQVLRSDDEHDAAVFREGWDRSTGGFRWRPSIHMPRWASRILLEVTAVRVERLHDMNAEDARAEGCPGGHGSIPGYGYSASPGEHFRHVWQSINGPDSWRDNPWVWVVEFKRADRRALEDAA